MIDWRTGAIMFQPDDGMMPNWSLVSAGDWAALHGFGEEMLKNPVSPYGKLLPIIREADLAIVNLETPLSDRGAPIVKDGPNLRGPAQAIDSLVQAGFDVATLANNHALDYGPEALEDTLELCATRDILTVGAGLTLQAAWAPVYVEVKNTRVAILAMAEHEEAAFWPGMAAGVAAWDIAKAVDAVHQAAAESDVVIYQCHVGTEYNPIPAPRLSEAFHRLVDAGASLVIGHHPHVPMGIEQYGGAIIAYSLGNFLFDFRHHNTPARVHEGYLLGIDFAGAEIVGGQIVPYRAVNGHHLERLRGEKERELLAHLQRISSPLGNTDLLWQYWWAFCDDLYHVRWEKNLPGIMDALFGDDPEARIREGAGRMRNIMRCEAHWDTLHTALDRLIEEKAGDSPPDIVAEVRALNPWLEPG